MGLLRWGLYEQEEKNKSRNNVKNDPTASGRSAIRRQPTIRQHNDSITDRRNGRTSPRAVRLSLSNLSNLANYVINNRDGDVVIAPRSRTRQADVGLAPEEGLQNAHNSEMDERQSQNTRHNSQRRRIWPRSVEPPSRGWRESSLRNEVRRDDDNEGADQDTQMQEIGASSSPAMDWIEREHRYWHTQASRSADAGSPAPEDSRGFTPGPRSRSPTRGPWDPSAHPEDDFPPLERQSIRHDHADASNLVTPRHLVSNVDGLGDRRRSLSPDGEADPWETLLTTITPDERLPSTESSFASTTASLSFSASETRADTAATSPSIVHHTSVPTRDCPELPGAGMQTPESLPELGSGQGLSARPDPPSNERRGSSQTRQYFEDARRELEREIQEYSRSRMQRLLAEFMDRDEAVPDEFWQAFVPRNLLAGAAAVAGNPDSERP